MCVQLAPKKPTDPKEKSENTDPTGEKPKATKAGPKKANGADKEAGKHRASSARLLAHPTLRLLHLPIQIVCRRYWEEKGLKEKERKY